MNRQQIAAARAIATEMQFADEYHLAMMICGAIGVDYEVAIAWIHTL